LEKKKKFRSFLTCAPGPPTAAVPRQWNLNRSPPPVGGFLPGRPPPSASRRQPAMHLWFAPAPIANRKITGPSPSPHARFQPPLPFPVGWWKHLGLEEAASNTRNGRPQQLCPPRSSPAGTYLKSWSQKETAGCGLPSSVDISLRIGPLPPRAVPSAAEPLEDPLKSSAHHDKPGGGGGGGAKATGGAPARILPESTA